MNGTHAVYSLVSSTAIFTCFKAALWLWRWLISFITVQHEGVLLLLLKKEMQPLEHCHILSRSMTR